MASETARGLLDSIITLAQQVHRELDALVQLATAQDAAGGDDKLRDRKAYALGRAEGTTVPNCQHAMHPVATRGTSEAHVCWDCHREYGHDPGGVLSRQQHDEILAEALRHPEDIEVIHREAFTDAP